MRHSIKVILISMLTTLIIAPTVTGEKKMKMPAVDFPNDLNWVNTDTPLSMERLKGHIVLLDFWTYCCINCIHVLPDLHELEQTFQNEPFIVIGVHSPKFDNEKKLENVQAAVSRYQIGHPVVMDNRHQLWQSYGIRAWPSFILIDAEGFVIGQLSGEGKKEPLKKAIADQLRRARKYGTLTSDRFLFHQKKLPSAVLEFPGKLDWDAVSNRLFISNSNRNEILSVNISESGQGEVEHVIGSGEAGFRDGTFKTAQFRKPQGIAYHHGKLYIADTENHAIRQADLNSELVTTLTGTGDQIYQPLYYGNAKNAVLNSPWDLAVYDNILYIAMAGNHQIWRLDLKRDHINNLVGNGRENIVDGGFLDAQLAQPSGIVFRKNRLYFTDSEVSAVRMADLTNSRVNTLVGTGLFDFGMQDGTLQQGSLQHPLGLDIHDDQIYIADTYNHAVRQIDLASGTISTLIQRHGSGVCSIDERTCDYIALFEPNDVLYADGILWIADTNNHLIRRFDLKTRTLTDLHLTNPDRK